MRCDTLDYFLCGGWQKKSPATEGERTYLSGNKDSNNLSNNKISSTDNFEDVCEVLRNDKNIFPREQYPLQPIGTAEDYRTPMPQVEDKGLKRNSISYATTASAFAAFSLLAIQSTLIFFYYSLMSHYKAIQREDIRRQPQR